MLFLYGNDCIANYYFNHGGIIYGFLKKTKIRRKHKKIRKNL